jgi:hypothetical protein
MGIFDSLVAGEESGMPTGILNQSGWRGALEGNNAMMNIGLGILANNSGNYGSAMAALGKGAQQGVQNTQTSRQAQMQQAMYKMKLDEAKKALEQQQKQQEWLKNYGQPNATQDTTTQAPDTWQNAMQGQTQPNFNMERVAGQQTTTQTPIFDQNKALLSGVQNGAIDFKDYLSMTAQAKPKYSQTPQYDQEGNAFVLDDSGNVKRLDGIKEKQELMVTPSGLAINKNDSSNIGKTFNADDNNPNKPFIMVNGQIVPNKAYQDYEIRKANAGASSNNISVNTGQKGFDNTLKLRGDFRSEPIYKAHQDVQSAHSQITAALKKASPAGDLAGATKLMKILDPGSVVRESELGMAMAASGKLDRMENYASMLMSGNKLTPKQRVDFQGLADELANESARLYNAKRDEYKGIASRNELNELDVLGNPEPIKPKQSAITGGGWSAKKVK